MPLSAMLRICFLQQGYGLCNPGAQEALYDKHSMRDFAGLDLGRDAIPDETTILNFRHLLKRHNLTEVLFAEVSSCLEGPALLLRGDAIMDATLIAASPSIKNKADTRPRDEPDKEGLSMVFRRKDAGWRGCPQRTGAHSAPDQSRDP